MTSSWLEVRSVSSARCWRSVGWRKPNWAARLSSQSGRWRCDDGSSVSASVCVFFMEDAEYKSVNVSETKFPSPHVS